MIGAELQKMICLYSYFNRGEKRSRFKNYQRILCFTVMADCTRIGNKAEPVRQPATPAQLGATF